MNTLTFTVEKRSQKLFGNLRNFSKYCRTKNNHRTCENSPNLVTLLESTEETEKKACTESADHWSTRAATGEDSYFFLSLSLSLSSSR
jgi:hypothetical protein